MNPVEPGSSEGARPGGDAVELSVIIAARPATIFRYLSDPTRMSAWLGAGATFEPRIGSALRLDFGPQGIVAGAIEEIVPDRRIVFTWGIEAGERHTGLPPGSSRVTVTLEPHPTGTRVTLRHDGLPTEVERQEHRFGWRHHLGQLSVHATRDEHGAGASALVDRYFTAWNEPDASKRAQILAECVADDVQVADPYAFFAGRQALVEHITNALRFMPGAMLERTAEPQLVHDSVRVPWRVRMPDGATAATGVNVLQLGADGAVQRVLGFWD